MAHERKRLQLPILGLNTSDPDHTVADGSCEQLANLRYVENAWRNVSPFRAVFSGYTSGGHTILYKHPVSPSNYYIARHDDKLREVRFYTDPPYVKTKEVLMVKELLTIPPGSEVRIAHFGSVLIVRLAPEKKTYYFFYLDGAYRLFTVPAPPVITDLSTDGPGSVKSMKPDYQNAGGSYHHLDVTGIGTPREACYKIFDFTTGEATTIVNDGTNDFWFGEMALFAAFRMKDGSTLSPSLLALFDSCSIESSSTDTMHITTKMQVAQYMRAEETICLAINQYSSSSQNLIRDPYPIPGYQRIRPVIEVSIPTSGIDTELVDRVTVYATRIKPPFDFTGFLNGKLNQYVDQVPTTPESLGARIVPIPWTEAWDDNRNLLQEPFYRLKEVNIADFTAGKYSLTLSYDILRDIAHNPLYEPNQSLHEVFGEAYFEYNSRVHFGNLTTHLYKGYPMEQLLDLVPNPRMNSNTVVTLRSEAENKYIAQALSGIVPSGYRGEGKKFRIISYPDYRAIRFQVLAGGWIVDARELHPNEAANFAFGIGEAYENLTKQVRNKYPPFGGVPKYDEGGAWYMGDDPYHHIIPDPPLYPAAERERHDNTLSEPNRLQASALNNPLSLPFELSYSIGELGNAIVALNAVSDQLSDAKFGEYPLLAFTTQGIFALQHGTGEVVYGSIVPINRDVIQGPNTIAAGHFVFYGTNRGLMAIRGRESTLISEPIHRQPGGTDARIPDGNAQLHYQHAFNELIVQWGDEAYLYSIPKGYWSTRDNPGRILNNQQVTNAGCDIFDLEQEVRPTKPVRFWLSTRPLKFGSAEFKRLETLILRMQSATDTDLELRIEGSHDKTNWTDLRTLAIASRNDITLRRTPLSFQFLRVTLSGSVTGFVTLNPFDIEFYHKYLHRLR